MLSVSCVRDIFIMYQESTIFISLITRPLYFSAYKSCHLSLSDVYIVARIITEYVEKDGSLQRSPWFFSFVKSVNRLWSERVFRSERTGDRPSPPFPPTSEKKNKS